MAPIEIAALFIIGALCLGVFAVLLASLVTYYSRKRWNPHTRFRDAVLDTVLGFDD